MDWRMNAACRGLNDDTFFPVSEKPDVIDGEGGPVEVDNPDVAFARAICASCPVLADCLSWALEACVDFGIFGGFTADERREMRRRHLRVEPRPAPQPHAGGRPRKATQVG